MANTKQARKRILVNARKRLRNMAIRSAVKTAFKKASAAIDGKKSTDAQELVKSAIIAVDTASSKGSIHKNTAARRKSRLMKKLNSLVTQAAS